MVYPVTKGTTCMECYRAWVTTAGNHDRFSVVFAFRRIIRCKHKHKHLE